MPTTFKYSGERKSHQSLNEVYFLTSVIKDWKYLLRNDEMKMILPGVCLLQALKQSKILLIHGRVQLPKAWSRKRGQGEIH